MRRIFLRTGGCVLSGLATCAALSTVLVMSSLHAMPSIDPRVTEQLETFGAARILIVLALPRVGEDASFAADTPARFLQDVLADDAFSVRQIGSLPIAVAEVNRAGFERLKENSSIAAIHVDEPQSPFLHGSLPLMEVDAAREAGILGTGYSIAILDTGVNYQHPFLEGKLQSEACFSNSQSELYNARTLCPNGLSVDLTPGSGLHCRDNAEQCSHGTHVAGIALGGPHQTEAYQASGVASGAGLIAIQVFTEFNDTRVCGSSGNTPCIKSFPSDQLAALEHVRTLADKFRIAAVNMSLGGARKESECDDDPRSAIIDELRDLGIATVVASGNDGFYNAVSEPACVPGAIAVGASKAGDIGLNIDFSNTSDLIDFVAPGTNIKSSLTDGFAEMTGTSMAAPHIAGTVALLRSHVPHATVKQIEMALQVTSKRTVDPRTNVELYFPDVSRAADALRILTGESLVDDEANSLVDDEENMAKALASVVGVPRIMVVVDKNGIVQDEHRFRQAMAQLRRKFGPMHVSQVAVNRLILENRQGFDSEELGYVIEQFGDSTKLYSDSLNSTH